MTSVRMPHQRQRTADPSIELVIGMKIAALRQRAGLTQAQLAEDCDMTRTSIANIERGHQGIPVTTLARIAEVLDVHPGTLFPVQGEIEELRVADLLQERAREVERQLRAINQIIRRVPMGEE